jgi:hypothetical protein
VSDETVSEHSIIERTCAGRCGALLSYLMAPSPHLHASRPTSKAPAFVLTCLDGVTAYREGHLCLECDTAVEEALTRHREQREQRETSGKQRPARRGGARAYGGRR